MRRLLILALPFALVTSASAAEEQLSKQQVIERSAPICRDLLEAVEPHIDKADEARAKEQWERFIHQARLAIDAARPYGRELQDLRPETGARKYGRFLDHGRAALNWLDRALDALENERTELALEREATAQEHFERAKRAAKRYGLRRPCIRIVG